MCKAVAIDGRDGSRRDGEGSSRRDGGLWGSWLSACADVLQPALNLSCSLCVEVVMIVSDMVSAPTNMSSR